jgi:serine/threonine protein kinase
VDGHAEIMDFGLAKKIGREDGTEQDIKTALTKEGSMVSTLAYMSPEQLSRSQHCRRSPGGSFGRPRGSALITLAVLVGAVLWWWSSADSRRSPAAPLKIGPFTTEWGLKQFPRFSPDGERVAYEWDGPGRDNVDILNPYQTGQRILCSRHVTIAMRACHPFEPI